MQRSGPVYPAQGLELLADGPTWQLLHAYDGIIQRQVRRCGCELVCHLRALNALALVAHKLLCRLEGVFRGVGMGGPASPLIWNAGFDPWLRR